MKNIKIICTLGPSSFDKKTLNLLKKEKIHIFRINLSHTNKNEIKSKILYLKKNKIKNICLDTEGAQIRTTETKHKFVLKKGSKVKIYNKSVNSNNKKIYLYPKFGLLSLKKGIKIDIGFNSLSLEVISKNLKENYLNCRVIESGILESKKGVHINSKINLQSLTDKDIFALELAKKMKIKYFAISFVNSHNDIQDVKKIIGNDAFIISKIETSNALKNLTKISNNSDALLIDRGDLSRYVPIEKIPVVQEHVVKFAIKRKKPTYVATNLLETMIKETQPTRAESHDVYSTLKQGVSGLVLAAETAIGSNPVECVKFLKRCIGVFKKN